MRNEVATAAFQLGRFKVKLHTSIQEAVVAKHDLAAAHIRHLAETKAMRLENERNAAALLESEKGTPVSDDSLTGKHARETHPLVSLV